MALGNPVCFDPVLDVQSISSIGIDCHSNNSTSIPSEMRLALQFARGTHNQRYIDAGKSPKTINKTVEEAFNLGTIQGARAIGREAELGSLKVERLADIVVFDATSPSMICAAQYDPVAAVVLHSSPGDVWMTIVDGKVRKAEGVLRESLLDEVAKEYVGNDVESVTWKDVATELLKGQKELQLKIDKIDMVAAREGVIKGFYINEASITDDRLG
jgi:Amidohydrolase family